MKRLFLFIPFVVCLQSTSARTNQFPGDSVNYFITANQKKAFQPVLAIELWGLYATSGNDTESSQFQRTDMMFRRFRLGAKGNPYTWVKFAFQLSLDRLGEDVYIPVKGSYKGINLWNAYVTLKALPNSELLNVHVGYYWAGISREFITSPYSSGSFDKTRANWFLRHFITGKGNGIEGGIGAGGLKKWHNFGIAYRLGVFEPQAFISEQYADKLYTGRFMLSIGQAEQTSYKFMLPGNQWRKRKGITIGVGAFTQKNGMVSDSLFFNKSCAYGADVLFNYKGLRIDGEYFMFTRVADGLDSFYGSQAHIRLGYSLVIANKYFEPVISYDRYVGEGNGQLYGFIGFDETWDIGINWYLNKDKLKLALHYIEQNSNFSGSGDYFGLALQFKL